MLATLGPRLRGLFFLLWREVMKFGTVGAIAYVIDSSVFILLREGALSHRTLVAGVLASVVATAFSWVANRYWTFRHRRRSAMWRELGMFCLMNAIGIGIATLCLFISHYVIGLETTQADFIAKNVVGLVLGTIFRFLAYRYWVFTEELADDPDFRFEWSEGNAEGRHSDDAERRSEEGRTEEPREDEGRTEEPRGKEPRGKEDRLGDRSGGDDDGGPDAGHADVSRDPDRTGT
ncbi:GtrA family protein [Arthrobacter castelli]|uniref:GtrA family protein n=1 Tax=Arthrobacter castelli TaxID=271431 RepID=UPI0004117E34|nr:GtrA family protein [Arthrobacter castelli]